jgi:RimJ/RimL family protein N-acetyltransferase
VGEDLETERLRLRPWSDSDAELLARLSADPRVVRYVGDGRCWTAERVAEVSGRMTEHWRAHGFGWRVAVEKQSGEPVGFAALNYLGDGNAGLDPDEFEIGWWLDPPSWGRGFASEAARAVRDEAFNRVGAPRLIARIQPANDASARVARGLGMSFAFETTGRFGEPCAVYRLLRDDARAPLG